MSGTCVLQLNNQCHQVKKGAFVCKHCWSIASPSEKETVKDFDVWLCAYPGCFATITRDESIFCNDHVACQIERLPTKITKETEAAVSAVRIKHEVFRSGRSKSPRRGAASSSGGPQLHRVEMACRSLKTPELETLANSVFDELTQRATSPRVAELE